MASALEKNKGSFFWGVGAFWECPVFVMFSSGLPFSTTGFAGLKPAPWSDRLVCIERKKRLQPVISFVVVSWPYTFDMLRIHLSGPYSIGSLVHLYFFLTSGRGFSHVSSPKRPNKQQPLEFYNSSGPPTKACSRSVLAPDGRLRDFTAHVPGGLGRYSPHFTRD